MSATAVTAEHAAVAAPAAGERAAGGAAAGAERAGVLLCVLAAAGFGTMAVTAKVAYGHGANVVTLLAVRFAIAAAVLWLIAWRRGLAPLPRLRGDRAAWALAFALGLGIYSVEAGLFYASVARIDASLAELLLFSYPALVVAGAIALRRESPSRRRFGALAFALGGVALVLLGGAAGALDPLGVACALGSACLYATFVLIADGIGDRLHPLALSALLCTGAAVGFALAGAVSGALRPGALDGSAWACAAAIALVSTVLSMAAFLGGVRRLGPGRASILSTLEPPITVLAAFVAFGEMLGPLQLAGGAGVLAAVLVLQAPASWRPPSRIERSWRLRSVRPSPRSSRVRARRFRTARDGHTSRSSTASARSRSSTTAR